MRYFVDVMAAYAASRASFRQGLTGFPALQDPIRLRQVNDFAYFALLFAQFESEINRLCAELIQRQQKQPDCPDRRAWTILEAHEERQRTLIFRNRVALLTRKGGQDYKRIMEIYDIRNQIAHGDLPNQVLNPSELAKELQAILARLQEAS